MIEITENIFAAVYTEVKSRIENETLSPLKDFKTNPFVVRHENYKYDVLEKAKNALHLSEWHKEEIGNGRITEYVRNSIQLKIDSNGRRVNNNLLDWRKKDDFQKLTSSSGIETNLIAFFKSRVTDEEAFNKFIESGFSYQLIAYIFFIKNSQKYLPISQERFDSIFKSMNLDFHTSNNISWDNYLSYNQIIKSFKIYLSRIHQDINLLDAHSFLWIYGFKFEKDKKTITVKSSGRRNTPAQENSNIHLPKAPVETENIPEDISEIDYIARHKRLMEIGKKAEEYVLRKEIEYLISQGFPKLAEEVRDVSLIPSVGCDILSFETTGQQKQIEVKAISTIDKNNSFIITKNELEKSRSLSNYYVYCITGIESGEPKIIRLKHPDFHNHESFQIEPLTYRVTFG